MSQAQLWVRGWGCCHRSRSLWGHRSWQRAAPCREGTNGSCEGATEQDMGTQSHCLPRPTRWPEGEKPLLKPPRGCLSLARVREDPRETCSKGKRPRLSPRPPLFKPSSYGHRLRGAGTASLPWRSDVACLRLHRILPAATAAVYTAKRYLETNIFLAFF